jgi:polysaccharide export outer membrane protein
MNKSIICLLFFLGIVMTACVPTKDLIYLQDNGNTSIESISKVEIKPYRLQTNDIISISIKANDPKNVEIFSFGENTQQIISEQNLYFSGYSVDDHGNIRIPVLGDINVLGFTLEETRLKIEKQLLEEYLKKESGVFVTVKLAGFRYTINGEVNGTGSKILYQDKVNIMEAIANAGDITVVGDRKDIKVIRQFPQGSETFSIDLTDKNAMQSPCYNLQPNDYIYVKPLKQKSWGTGTTGIQSLGTIITLLSLATTTFLLLKN